MAGPPVVSLGFKRVDYYKVYRFELESIPKNDLIADAILPLPPRGEIYSVAIVCPTSLKFGAYLSTFESPTHPLLDVPFYTEDQSQKYTGIGLNIPYYNNETPMQNRLWLAIWNDDKINPTGPITVEIGVDERGFDRSI